ncbi:bifunctional folylpolyglutamate synthase/dihydrofolate synthase [Desulfovibrio desulfuricans]|uniref:Dihydrofolate synthase/folylpolyglutamate synthase n=2 Tax=Nitratidesulfovibrio vulgaris TaxID=881 RepID=A0A0H3A656_NITV4|nr:FolC bifunctional protein [Nitratidesulfovibrio vulgaris DP4]GEB79570.1 bifunctional folylpolyglutamate synthase/dihydrofolate synthase [Desulfovibrio desulfuricans]
MFRTYDDVVAHLEGLGLFHMDFGLDRMHAALAALDLTRPPYAVAQVVGTNGKGSTSTFLASIAQAHGLRTGLYTSPHFLTPRERIRIDGRMLEADLWPLLGNRILDAGGANLTYFEFLTVLGALAFREAGVDMAVIEAGLGGTWDATTALAADILCVTPIGLDHQHVLGPTITAIATDKAGAMREGHMALTAPQCDEALSAIEQAAATRGTRLVQAATTTTLPSDAHLGLAGPHQRDNATLALAAWRTIAATRGWTPSEAAERHGLASAHIAGRFQRVEVRLSDLPVAGVLPAGFHPSDTHPTRIHPADTCPSGNCPSGDCPAGPPPDVSIPSSIEDTPDADTTNPPPCRSLPFVLDGAHNIHGLTALRTALEAQGLRPAAVIFSCLADKDTEALVPLLHDIAAGAPVIVPTIADNERAADGATLARRMGPNARAVPRLHDALREAARLAGDATVKRPVLLCGSLYLLAEFFTLRPDLLESPAEATGCAASR